MNIRSKVVLGALASANGAFHTPVQVQKLFFLLDQKVPTWINGPIFNFQPRDYGPFDRSVYDELEALSAQGYVEIDRAEMKRFRISNNGQVIGEEFLSSLPDHIRKYISELSKWVRNQSFADLVSAIYKEYPAMKLNSIFRD